MDEVLLRRLTGALALLVAALVLTFLLPGPVPEPVTEDLTVVTYDLGTGQVVGAGLPAVEVHADPAPDATPDVGKPADGKGAGVWHVQIGSFEDRNNARSAQQNLEKLKLPVTIQTVRMGKDARYRVQVGPYPDAVTARRALERIRRQGYRDATLVH
ncbi:MAG: SPOR domain-containing protein [Nevskiales bacterium]|nr:SPOR domain-containing protein [Nevskiales bacterium]